MLTEIASAQTVHFVKPDGECSSSCNSWANAFSDLQLALQAAGSGDEIWVASGVYVPVVVADPGDITVAERQASFQLIDGVSVFGGFSGNESNRHDRNWRANPTVLSGNIVDPPTNPNSAIEDVDASDFEDFSYQVVTSIGNNDTAVLDGFIITGGNADGSDPLNAGGGLFISQGSPSLTNLRISNNKAGFGGGVLLQESSSVLRNLIIEGNEAGSGGGLYSLESSATLVNVLFTNNFAVNGGAAFIDNGSPTFINVTLTGNLANLFGAGLFNTSGSSPVLQNAIIWENTGLFGISNVYNDDALQVISFSLIQESGGSADWDSDFGTDAGNNFDANPAFADAPSGDFRLASGSPGINAGNSQVTYSAFPVDRNENPIDLQGNARFQGSAVDLGAFESDGLSILLTGQEGLRLLASPVEVSLADFLSPIWTQGVAGGTVEFGSPNVWIWNNASTDDAASNWQPANLNTLLSPGDGVLVHVFENDIPDEPGIWPKQLSVEGTPFSLPFSADVNPNPGGFTLIGNPSVSGLSWNDVITHDLDEVVYVWDPNDDNWKTFDGNIGELEGGRIHPFQSFFVRTANDAENPSLDIQKTSPPAVFFGKQSEVQQPFAVRLHLESDHGNSSTWLRFTEDGDIGKDRGDALKLPSLSGGGLSLSTASADHYRLDINHLPLSLEDITEIPLHIEVALSGTYSFEATRLKLPENWGIGLVDKQHGVKYELSEATPIEIRVDESMSGGNPGFQRFLIEIDPGKEFRSMLPVRLDLMQNYPNPFNPVTVIRFELPQRADVLLEIFDLLGRRVALLKNEVVEAGFHEVRFDASAFSSGVYVYRLQSGGTTMVRKMTLVR